MRGAKNGLRALGLCFLIVAGLMALGAAGAQGQSAGTFLDLVGGVAKVVANGTTFTGAQEGNASLLVPGLGVSILCTIKHIEGVIIAIGTSDVTVLFFLICITLTSALAPLGACKIGNGKTIKAAATFLARKASAADASVAFVLAEPLTGTEFASVKIENETGKFCSVSGTYPVTGTLALKPLAGHANPQLLIPYANQALLGDAGLKLGVHAATLDASDTIEITTAGLAGTPFGVC